jgi:predicted transcriptional regulator
MNERVKSFLALTAHDVMMEPPEVIGQDETLRGAAQRFRRSQISGAPVVDAEGRCVGVLSAADYIADRSPDEPVQKYMTTDVVTASPDTPLADLAQMLVDAHIHRLIVTDEEGRPVGVVASTDVVAAVARLATGRPLRRQCRHGCPPV